MAEVIDGILINEVEAKNIMTKSSLPVGGYSVNPYVGCTHACKYCYASFMKRFTGHKETPGAADWQRCRYSDLHKVRSCGTGYRSAEEAWTSDRFMVDQHAG